MGHQVVIVGGGFGGLFAAQHLRKAEAELILIDRRNHHLFQPLLYQVATGQLSPANIATPLRALVRRQKNTRVLLGEVVDVDAVRRQVVLSDGMVPYDTLIIAAGARHHYFGNDQWERIAPGLKSLEDATEIRRRILLAYEAAERETDPMRLHAWLTFVVVGGGPTGVELAGAIAELAHGTLRHNFRRFDPADSRVLLLEGADRILPTFPAKLSEKAERALNRLGVTVRTHAIVTDVQPERVLIKAGGGVESIPTRTVLWGAGVQASPLGKALARAVGAELDRAGRVVVQPDCTLPGHPEIFVIGDMARLQGRNGKPLPGVAPVAMQQGEYVARVIQARLRSRELPGPFVYHDRGSMATVGRAAAVVDLGWLRFSGFFAWLTWLFIHLLYLVQFQNRALVLIQWAYGYLTRSRSARLITGEGYLPLCKTEALPPLG